jgi:hypothetical protein
MAEYPEAVSKTWVQAINAGDLERVLALYNEKAVLIPAFSNRVFDLSHTTVSRHPNSVPGPILAERFMTSDTS